MFSILEGLDNQVRITNDTYSPIDVLAEIVVPRGMTSEGTRRFFVDEKVSHNWLVQQWGELIEAVLDSFKRYGVDVNATQFIRDHGTDILLQVDNHQGKRWRLGLQIKSEREALGNAKRKKNEESMLGTLKRQAFEASEKVDEWWILCCFDQTQHHALVQAISSELIGGRREQKIRVIDPRSCASALQLSEARVDALCTILLCQDDSVLRAARAEVLNCHPAVADFVLRELPVALTDGRRISRENVGIFFEEASQGAGSADWEDGPDESVDGRGAPEGCDTHEAIYELERAGFLVTSSFEDDYSVMPAAFPGLCALFFEARVRHELDESAAAQYMRALVHEGDK